MEEYDINSILELNFSNESADIQLPQNIVDCINQCLLKCEKYNFEE
jgi:hypothetical protein